MLNSTRKPASETLRLDKWLWCARLYKTRSDAAEALRSGKVQVAGERVKASRLAAPGMVLQIRSGALTREITVLALSPQRLSATAAAALYQENAESLARREQHAAQLKLDRALHPRTPGRPTKRDRRRIIRFRRASAESPEDTEG
jgi:ribosome-associated heat shock protein Hsp15